MDLNSLMNCLDDEENGKWYQYDTKTKFKLARFGNKTHTAKTKALLNEHNNLANGGIMTTEEQIEMNAILMSTIVVDWKGLIMNGKKLDYSEDAVKDIWMDDRLKDFRKAIEGYADNGSNFRERVVKSKKK